MRRRAEHSPIGQSDETDGNDTSELRATHKSKVVGSMKYTSVEKEGQRHHHYGSSTGKIKRNNEQVEIGGMGKKAFVTAAITVVE